MQVARLVKLGRTLTRYHIVDSGEGTSYFCVLAEIVAFPLAMSRATILC